MKADFGGDGNDCQEGDEDDADGGTGWERGEEDGEQWGKMWGSDMAGGLWLSSSGRAKAKDPWGDAGYISHVGAATLLA